MADRNTILSRPLGGLSLMTFLTAVWALMAAFWLGGIGGYIVLGLFGVVELYFLYQSYQLKKVAATLPTVPETEDPKKQRWYWIIFVAEGLAILITRNVLIWVDASDYFVCGFALIVALHFFPLAWVFGRRFDIYIGAFCTLVALAGVVFIWLRAMELNLINGGVCIACGLATSLYAFRMVREANALSQ